MRDADAMRELLNGLANEESGRLVVTPVGGNWKEYHQAELLVDEGHAEWVHESVLRITSEGYRFLAAVTEHPPAWTKFVELINAGASYAEAVAAAIDIAGKATGFG